MLRSLSEILFCLQAEVALEVMRDPRRSIADKLTSQDGINSFGKNKDGHRRTQGIDGTNDSSENKFALLLTG